MRWYAGCHDVGAMHVWEPSAATATLAGQELALLKTSGAARVPFTTAQLDKESVLYFHQQYAVASLTGMLGRNRPNASTIHMHAHFPPASPVAETGPLTSTAAYASMRSQ